MVCKSRVRSANQTANQKKIFLNIDGCGAVAPPARASRASLLLRANRLAHSLRSLEAPIDVIKSHLANFLSGLPQVRKHLLSVEIKPPFLLAAAVLFLGGSLAPHRRSRGRRADELGVDCKAKNTEFIFPGLGGSLAPHRRSRAGHVGRRTVIEPLLGLGVAVGARRQQRLCAR